MVKSMTGYGMAKGPVGGQQVTVEIRSLNSKFLELNMRLPGAFRDRELELRSDLSRQLERGKADMQISIENSDVTKRSSINREVFNSWLQELRQLAGENNLKEDSILDIIMRQPTVLNNDKQEVDEDQWKQLKALVAQALEQFNGFRLMEGKVLENDLRGRITAITGAMPIMEQQEQARIDAVRKRLTNALNDLKEQMTVDQNRFEQELIYYIEKLDISEEKVRLRSHCEYFLQTLSSPEANGKKLGFIAQEIGREINTMGAKANDATMQRTVVEMKDELEKLKEQLANVL